MYRQEKLKGVQFKIITISHLFSFSNENLITIHLFFLFCRPLLYGLVSHFVNSSNKGGKVFLRGAAAVNTPGTDA